MSQPTITELDKDKIFAQLARLPKHAYENKWQYEYDKGLDELVYGIDEMPDDSFLFNVNNELNLFLTPDSEVKGIFIEYFASNFIEHNKDLKPVLSLVEHSNRKNVDKEKEVLAKDALEGKLVTEALESLLEKDKLLAALL